MKPSCKFQTKASQILELERKLSEMRHELAASQSEHKRLFDLTQAQANHIFKLEFRCQELTEANSYLAADLSNFKEV